MGTKPNLDTSTIKGASLAGISAGVAQQALDYRYTLNPWDPYHPDYGDSNWMNQKGGVLTRNKMLFLPGMPGGEGAFLGGPGEGVVSLPGMNTLEQINNGTFARELAKDISMSGSGPEKETNIHVHLYIDGNEIGYTVAKQARTNNQLIGAIRGAI